MIIKRLFSKIARKNVLIDDILGKKFEITVRKSPFGGHGVFSLKHFYTGDIIEACSTLEVSSSDIHEKSVLREYLFEGNSHSELMKNITEHNLILVHGCGMLYNHSQEPNCFYEFKFVDGKRYLIVTAAHDIEADSELLISYGDAWWSNRRISPSSGISSKFRNMDPWGD